MENRTSDRIPPLSKELRNNVLMIRICRPEAENRIDPETGRLLTETLNEAAADASLRCIILTGSGHFFLTGIYKEEGSAVPSYIEALRNQKVPVIAAVNGDCLSDGMDVLAEADLAVAAETARFGWPGILSGKMPVMEFCSAVKAVSKKNLLNAFYTGALFTAAEAADAALVNRTVPEDQVMAAAETYAKKLLNKPADLIALGREAYFTMAELPLPERRAFGMKILPKVIAAEARYADAHKAQ